jgi:DNA-binding protein HU-beta
VANVKVCLTRIKAVRKIGLMTKQMLIEKISRRHDIQRHYVERIISALTESIAEALQDNQAVQLPKLGTFKIKSRKEKIIRHPKTQELIVIPAGRIAAFSLSQTLKKSINS